MLCYNDLVKSSDKLGILLKVFSGYQPHQLSVWNWCF